MGYIYKIVNRMNSKVYVGQTVQSPKKRWHQHELSSFNEKRKDSFLPLHRAMRKYGLSAFEYSIIEECDDEKLNEREIYWIEYYNSADRTKGYNVSLGGGGSTYYASSDILALWFEGCSVKEISFRLGMDRGFCAVRLKACGISDDEIKRRRYRSAQLSTGFPVYQYSLEGEYVGMFASVQEARKATGIGHIESCCNGKQKQAGGYIWSYVKCDRVPSVVNDYGATKKRKVFQYNLDGYKIGEYDSAYDAEKKLKISDDQIRDVCLGKKYTAGGYYWSYVDASHIDVVLPSNTGKPRRVGKYDKDTGELLCEYESMASAAHANNISNVGNITSACCGRYKTCGGYVWKYI